ncbi:MAG: hypothetical protein R3B07_31705 [Polyangiaceae bacterium]
MAVPRGILLARRVLFGFRGDLEELCVGAGIGVQLSAGARQPDGDLERPSGVR